MKSILLLLFTVAMSVANGQQLFTVSVAIQTPQSKPVEGATVSLLRSKDSVLMKTAIASKEGTVEFANVKPGSYLVNCTMVGFSKGSSQVFLVADNMQLASVIIQPAPQTLTAVTVETKKPFIERKIDRLVVNVENSIVSAGSSAFEILEKSPGIIIDQNDNISLKGKAGVIIMIDGKPSPLVGTDLASFLRAQPANAIERIEIITNPSSRYDASGNAGLVNIIMKKDKRMGTNGNINIGAGQGIYFRTNEGININHREKKFNIFGSYNYSQRKALNDLTIDRSFYNGNQLVTRLDLFNHMVYPSHNHNGRIGIDFFATRKTIVGILLNGVLGYQDKLVENISNQFNQSGIALSKFSTNSFTEDRLKHYGINFNIKHSIDTKGQEITFDADRAIYDKTSNPAFVTTYFDGNNNPTGQPYLLDGQMLGKLTIHSVKSDYTKPLNNSSKLEAGFKTSFVKADNDLAFYDNTTGSMQFDAGRSNHFIYEENINAAYISVNKEVGKIAVQLGLRAEQANIKAVQQVTNEKIDTSYLRVFPTAFFTYKPHKNHEFGLSYSRRIQRPTYNQLNPFKSFIDLTSYNTGNPYLRPEFTNSFELSYTLKQKTTLTLSYSRTNDVIAWIIKPVFASAGTVSVETNDNLESSDYFGLNISNQLAITKWWNAVNNADLYTVRNNGFVENTVASNGQFTYNLNTNHSFTLKNKWTAELSANYRSAEQSPYAYSRAQWQMNAGIQKVVFKGLGTFRANVSDIFRTQFPRITSSFVNYSQYFTAARDTRALNVSLTYRFGKNTVAAARRRVTGVEDEKARAQ